MKRMWLILCVLCSLKAIAVSDPPAQGVLVTPYCRLPLQTLTEMRWYPMVARELENRFGYKKYLLETSKEGKVELTLSPQYLNEKVILLGALNNVANEKFRATHRQERNRSIQEIFALLANRPFDPDQNMLAAFMHLRGLLIQELKQEESLASENAIAILGSLNPVALQLLMAEIHVAYPEAMQNLASPQTWRQLHASNDKIDRVGVAAAVATILLVATNLVYQSNLNDLEEKMEEIESRHGSKIRSLRNEIQGLEAELDRAQRELRQKRDESLR